MNLNGKNILLGISAGIAAYKAPELVRYFQKCGAEVKCLLTPNAEQFVSPMVLATLSKNKVYQGQFDYDDYDIDHIALTNWADILVIAPATANTISKIAMGIADNLLTSTVCAFSKPILLVPAMNVNMLENPVIVENLEKLSALGYHILPPDEGELACGVTAKGRMPEFETISKKVEEIFALNKKNKKILITTGGTKENIDPVRYIGNYSSGKMGIAVADEAYRQGYDVVLVSTVAVDKPYLVINVKTAQEMLDAVKEEFLTSDALIMVAAVADYRPVVVADNKIKKDKNENLTIELVKNPDVLKEMGKVKRENQLIIGFCAESENLIEYATKKINEKNLDFIVANDISRSDIGFGSDFNEITLLGKDGSKKVIERTTKKIVAENIINMCLKNFQI